MSTRTPLSRTQVESLRAECPWLPTEYFVYIETVGWGEADSGRMVYSGPVVPSSIYGARFAKSRIVLLGDDMQGYCFGFDPDSKRLGEISDSGEWQPWPEQRSFTDYVRSSGDTPAA